nr:hypothetical protein [Tanacetum cinerariifolium]
GSGWKMETVAAMLMVGVVFGGGSGVGGVVVEDGAWERVGSGGGVGCVVVVPVVERHRSGVGGGVVLAAWVVVLAVGRRTLPEKWRRRGSGVTRWWWRVKESGVDDRVDRETRNLFGFARKIPPEKFSGGGRVVAGWPAGGWGREYFKECVCLFVIPNDN